MNNKKNKEGVSRPKRGGQRGGHAVAMGTGMGTARRRRLLARCQPERPPTLRVPDYSKHSFDLIRLRLVEAVDTLHCLPLTGRDRPPKNLVAHMPPFVRQAWESYGYDKTRSPRPVATIEQITRMEEAVIWLLWIKNNEDRQVVWAMAHRLPRGKIARKMKCSRRTVYRREWSGLLTIAKRLKK